MVPRISSNKIVFRVLLTTRIIENKLWLHTSLHAPQHGCDATPASGGIPGVKTLPVIPICNVDTLATSDRMGVDRGCGMDTMLEFFLHLSVHDEERVMRQMDCNLTLSVCPL